MLLPLRLAYTHNRFAQLHVAKHLNIAFPSLRIILISGNKTPYYDIILSLNSRVFTLSGKLTPNRMFTQVEGLAKHLRCVGIDAAIPHSKKPEPRCSYGLY